MQTDTPASELEKKDMESRNFFKRCLDYFRAGVWFMLKVTGIPQHCELLIEKINRKLLADHEQANAEASREARSSSPVTPDEDKNFSPALLDVFSFLLKDWNQLSRPERLFREYLPILEKIPHSFSTILDVGAGC